MMTREEFAVCIDHFNNEQFDEAVSCCTDDVVVQYFVNMFVGVGKPLRLVGKQAFNDRYNLQSKSVKATLELGKFVTDGKNIYTDLLIEYKFIEDMPDFSAGPMKKGDVLLCTDMLLYYLSNDGKIKEIHVGHHRIHDSIEPR